MNDQMKQRWKEAKKRIGRAYHDYGRLCAAHPKTCLTMSLLTMIVLSYPTVTRLRLPISTPIDVFWSEHLHVNEKIASFWINENPASYIQQFIVSTTVTPWNATEMSPELAVRAAVATSFRWPAVAHEYNISLNSRYVTFLPPIVIQATVDPQDPLLQKIEKSPSEHPLGEEEDAPVLRSRIDWLEMQLKMYLAAFWILLITTVISFFAYVFLSDRWKVGGVKQLQQHEQQGADVTRDGGKMLKNLLVLSLLVFSTQKELESAPYTDDPWDLDGPCQKYVEKFAVYQSQMVACATNWSIPPKVCTNCYQNYIDFKTYEYQTKHLDTVYSLDNRTCSQVIYDNYLLSYSSDISTALTSKIWEKSRCDSCVEIAWNLPANKSTPSFTERTLIFQNRLYEWRNCVVNYTSIDGNGSILEQEDPSDPLNLQNGSKICNQCRTEFDELYKYYWKIYTTPDVDFCVDVETTMNDTIHLWDDVWQCAERQDRNRDLFGIMITFATLVLLTALFYAASYIQGGGPARNLVRYSRLSDPRGQRSRLLSSGMSDADLVHRVAPMPTTSTTAPIHQMR